MSDKATDLADAHMSPLAAALRVTEAWKQPLLEPILRELRQEKCAHMWQPVLADAPAGECFAVFMRLMQCGRPTTVFTYSLPRADGGEEPVAVATMSPRVASDSPEDGIPVLGRTYVRPAFRGRLVYAQVLRHRLELCARRWGDSLLGVHIGTSSARVESVFRASFPGRTIRLGDEDIGAAGVVAALLGLTPEFDRQAALPAPAHLQAEQRLLSAYLAQGAAALPVAEALPALRALAGMRPAHRILLQFLEALPDLR